VRLCPVHAPLVSAGGHPHDVAAADNVRKNSAVRIAVDPRSVYTAQSARARNLAILVQEGVDAADANRLSDDDVTLVIARFGRQAAVSGQVRPGYEPTAVYDANRVLRVRAPLMTAAEKVSARLQLQQLDPTIVLE